MTEQQIVDIMQQISFAPIRLKPRYVRFNPDDPPEFEVKRMPGEMDGQRQRWHTLQTYELKFKLKVKFTGVKFLRSY